MDDRGGRTLFFCRAGCTQAAVIAALRARGVWRNANPAPAHQETPLAAALRDFLGQPWNDETLLENYAAADAIRAAGRFIGAVRRSAVTDDEATWGALAKAARMESELFMLENEI